MPEFTEMYNRQRKWMFYLLSIYVIGWGFTSYHSIFMGLILGTVCSFLNLSLLVRKMKKFDKAISKGKKVRSLGSLSRLSVAALAAVIAIKWSYLFQIGSVILGLMTAYVVIMIDYFFYTFILHK